MGARRFYFAQSLKSADKYVSSRIESEVPLVKRVKAREGSAVICHFGVRLKEKMLFPESKHSKCYQSEVERYHTLSPALLKAIRIHAEKDRVVRLIERIFHSFIGPNLGARVF